MKKTIITSLMAIASLQLWGAGFQVLEQGASNMGTALAGSTVNANGDASAAFWNPSAAFFFDGELKIDAAGNFLAPYFHFHNEDSTTSNPNKGDGGNAGSLAFVPNMYTAWKFAEDWAVTMSITSPYGLSTEYDSNFMGSYEGLYSELFTIDINPSIAYRPFKGFSIAAGISAQYLYANMTSQSDLSAYPGGSANTDVGMKATSWGIGYNFGATYEYMENGRIGLSYRSEVKHSASGDMYLSGTYGYDTTIESDMSMPASINFGVYQRFWGSFKDFALMFDYQWTQWSVFDSLDIYESNGTLHSTEENWRDTSRFSFGMHYYANEDLTLRCGIAWDQGPVTSPEYRTVRIPDTDRVWFSGGIGYKYHNFNFDFAYTYIMMNDSDIENSDLSGYYTGSAHVISFQMGIVF